MRGEAGVAGFAARPLRLLRPARLSGLPSSRRPLRRCDKPSLVRAGWWEYGSGGAGPVARTLADARNTAESASGADEEWSRGKQCSSVGPALCPPVWALKARPPQHPGRPQTRPTVHRPTVHLASLCRQRSERSAPGSRPSPRAGGVLRASRPATRRCSCVRRWRI